MQRVGGHAVEEREIPDREERELARRRIQPPPVEERQCRNHAAGDQQVANTRPIVEPQVARAGNRTGAADRKSVQDAHQRGEGDGDDRLTETRTPPVALNGKDRRRQQHEQQQRGGSREGQQQRARRHPRGGALEHEVEGREEEQQHQEVDGSWRRDIRRVRTVGGVECEREHDSGHAQQQQDGFTLRERPLGLLLRQCEHAECHRHRIADDGKAGRRLTSATNRREPPNGIGGGEHHEVRPGKPPGPHRWQVARRDAPAQCEQLDPVRIEIDPGDRRKQQDRHA
jgi:hypothetical protein